jgi:hypothetical protein
MQINGIGTTLLGVGSQDEHNVAIATRWFTFVYLPVIPLARLKVQFLPHQGGGFSFRIIEKLPFDAGEIARGYFNGWIATPLAAFGPMFFAVSEVWEALGLPEAWHSYYIAATIVWLIFAVWQLSERREARCRPLHPLADPVAVEEEEVDGSFEPAPEELVEE